MEHRRSFTTVLAGLALLLGPAGAADIRGIVLSPDGKPVADAAVVLVAPGYEALFRNGRFEKQHGNRDEKLLEGMTARTGPEGRFSIAARIPAHVAVIIAEAGYAERTPAQLEASEKR